MSTLSLDDATIRERSGLGWSQVGQCFADWWRRARSRDELKCLDYSGLHDIGISRATADFEASKPFWQA